MYEYEGLFCKTAQFGINGQNRKSREKQRRAETERSHWAWPGWAEKGAADGLIRSWPTRALARSWASHGPRHVKASRLAAGAGPEERAKGRMDRTRRWGGTVNGCRRDACSSLKQRTHAAWAAT